MTEYTTFTDWEWKFLMFFFIFLKFENILSSTFGCRPVFQLCYRQKSIILAFWSKITKEICNLLISGVLLSQSIGIKTYIRQSPTCLEWYQVPPVSLGVCQAGFFFSGELKSLSNALSKSSFLASSLKMSKHTLRKSAKSKI